MIPEKDGSSPKRSIIFLVSPLGETGLLPPPVFCLFVAILECTFLAELTIPLHFSFISVTDLLQTPKEFTWSVISSHTLLLFLFVIAFVNLLFIIFMFSSATVKSNVHSAAVKFGFLARFAGSLFQPSLLTKSRSSDLASKRAAYPVDSYSGHYPGFVQRLFIQRITIQWIAVLSSG